MHRGYIYLREHENYEIHDIYKLGKTGNFLGRDSTYSTGEYIRGKFIFAIESLTRDKKRSRRRDKISSQMKFGNFVIEWSGEQ